MNDYYTKIADFFHSGGIFMYPLAVCAVLAGAAFIYKCLTLRSCLIMPESLVRKMEAVIAGEAAPETLSEEGAEAKSVLARLSDCISQNKEKSPEQIKEIIQVQAKDEFIHLQNGIPILEMVINVAPMLGILGTASGLVVVFDSFGDMSNQAGISVGIAQALNTTITGLAIAAPSVVAQMYFSRKLEKISSAMEILLMELVDAIKSK